MYKELEVEGLEGCWTFAAARTCPTKALKVGCWLAGWLRAQPLDSATYMRLHIARPTCISSLPWGRPLLQSARLLRPPLPCARE